MGQDNQSVYSATSQIINNLSHLLDSSSGKALLANLRNSINRPLSETIDIWPILFENLPESFLGNGGRLTKEEEAILTTLQLYAIHQQGNSDSVLGSGGRWDNIGNSLKSLREADNSLAIDRRYNAMITSSTYEELIHHLRQLIRLLKSKSEVKVNYPKLAEDLYWFLRGYEEKVRLKWARSYYSAKQMNKGENENEN